MEANLLEALVRGHLDACQDGVTMRGLLEEITSNEGYRTLCMVQEVSKAELRDEIKRQLRGGEPAPAVVAIVEAAAAAAATMAEPKAEFEVAAAAAEAEPAAAVSNEPIEIVARALLEASEPLAARDVARLCGWKGRKSVNKHLYALQRAGRAQKSVDMPPRWTAGSAAATASGGASSAAAAVASSSSAVPAAAAGPPPAKRQRTSSGGGGGGAAAAAGDVAVGSWSAPSGDVKDGSSYLLLHRGKEDKRITVTKFGGAPRVDIRGWYDADGVKKPGRKGIMLTAAHWEMLLAAAPEINARLAALL